MGSHPSHRTERQSRLVLTPKIRIDMLHPQDKAASRLKMLRSSSSPSTHREDESAFTKSPRGRVSVSRERSHMGSSSSYSRASEVVFGLRSLASRIGGARWEKESSEGRTPISSLVSSASLRNELIRERRLRGRMLVVSPFENERKSAVGC